MQLTQPSTRCWTMPVGRRLWLRRNRNKRDFRWNMIADRPECDPYHCDRLSQLHTQFCQLFLRIKVGQFSRQEKRFGERGVKRTLDLWRDLSG